MNRDDIIRMAREAGMEQEGLMFYSPYDDEFDVHIDHLEAFTKLVAAAEREACAKDVSNALYGQVGCGKAIEAIRARGAGMIYQQNVFCPKCHNTPQICRCSHEQKKEWVGLTDEEIENCFEMSMFGTCRAIEAKLKEKNEY